MLYIMSGSVQFGTVRMEKAYNVKNFKLKRCFFIPFSCCVVHRNICINSYQSLTVNSFFTIVLSLSTAFRWESGGWLEVFTKVLFTKW